MKKVLLVILFTVIIATPAFAVPTIKLNAGTYQTGVGGPFKATVLTEGVGEYAVGEYFDTFCIEKNEYFYYGQTYYAEVSTTAKDGGVGGPNPDPICAETAWLYNEFLDGNLNIDSTTKSGLLQKAIWMLEEEIAMDTSNMFIQHVAQYCDWTDIGNIRVMNVWKYADFTGHCQDQLIRIPNAVPAPGAITLGGLGTLFVGWLRRRNSI